MTVGSEKLALLKTHADFVTRFFGLALSVKQVRDEIVIASSIRSSYNFETERVPNADVVIIMTARPVPHHKIAGTALHTN